MIRRRLTYRVEPVADFEYAQFARYKALGLRDLTAYILTKPANAHRLMRGIDSEILVQLLQHALVAEARTDSAVTSRASYLRRNALRPLSSRDEYVGTSDSDAGASNGRGESRDS